MPRLTATFRVSLSSPLFVNRPPWREGVRTIQELGYATANDSDIEIRLLEIDHAMTRVDRDENILYGPIQVVPRMRVSVSRFEPAEPPSIRRVPEGERSSRGQANYFHERILIYRNLALQTLRRLLRFFRYRQAHTLLHNPTGTDFDNPKWADETGQEVPSSVHLLEGSLYGIELEEEVGIQALASADDPALQQALAEPPIQPELYEQLLSDARAALFQEPIPLSTYRPTCA